MSYRVGDDRSCHLCRILATPGYSSGTVPSPFWIEIDSGFPYYLPKTALVTAFAPIKWRNTTGTHHTITYEGCEGGEKCLFDSGAVTPEGSYELPRASSGQLSIFLPAPSDHARGSDGQRSYRRFLTVQKTDPRNLKKQSELPITLRPRTWHDPALFLNLIVLCLRPSGTSRNSAAPV